MRKLILVSLAFLIGACSFYFSGGDDDTPHSDPSTPDAWLTSDAGVFFPDAGCGCSQPDAPCSSTSDAEPYSPPDAWLDSTLDAPPSVTPDAWL